METTAPPVMTIAEVAEYLRIPRASLYKLAQEGRIPCQKVGRHWRFSREALTSWLASRAGQSHANDWPKSTTPGIEGTP